MKMGILYNERIIAACVLYHVSTELSINITPCDIVHMVYKKHVNETSLECSMRMTKQLKFFKREMKLFKTHLNQEVIIDIDRVWENIEIEAIRIREQMIFIDDTCVHNNRCECYSKNVSTSQLYTLRIIDNQRIVSQIKLIHSISYIIHYLNAKITLYLQSHGMNKSLRQYSEQCVANMIVYYALYHRIAQPFTKRNRQTITLPRILKRDINDTYREGSKILMKELKAICNKHGNNKRIILSVDGGSS
jgi:hypothetical protein